MDDLISRRDAKSKKVYSHERHEYVVPVAELDWLPSAQPYTEEEIQAMQDLEQAQLDKAYQIGVEEGLQSAQPEQIARDIATIIENEQDMRVILQNEERTGTHSCENKHTETHDSRREWYMKGYRDAQPRWISVEEALPEDDKRVLCQMKGGELVFGFHHGKYWAYGHKPIAWFPLPEPYAERRQDGQTNR